MPTLKDNEIFWSSTYDWSHSGDKWSLPWGGVKCHWYGCLLPRIHLFVPTRTILEIGPGYGRWSQFLVPLCDQLILVDMASNCIQACQKRFSAFRHIEYFINDGTSLNMIPDHSVDFIFSFDSLVHAELTVLSEYLQQIASKLKKNGVVFIHHSNIGEYSNYFSFISKLPFRDFLAGIKLIENSDHWRAFSVTAANFRKSVDDAGLICIGQEKINWYKNRRMIDCISIITQKGAIWERPCKVFSNSKFMEEAKQLSNIAKLYGMDLFPGNKSGNKNE